MAKFCNLFSRLSKVPRKSGQARNQNKAQGKFRSTRLLDLTERLGHLRSFTAVEIGKTKESQRSLSITLAGVPRLAYLNRALLQGPSGPSNFYTKKSFLSMRYPELGRWSRSKDIEQYIVSRRVTQYVYFQASGTALWPGASLPKSLFAILIRWYGQRISAKYPTKTYFTPCR